LFSLLPHPRSTLFPYTTLFRSNAFYSPALVFAPNARQGNARDVGNTASHEAGHTFGLAHHGIDDDEYYGDTPAEPDSLWGPIMRSEEHTSELQSRENLVCRLLL